MKKKLFMMLTALLFSAASFAQFEQDKLYVNASLSGFDLNFTGAEKWKCDLNLKTGYLFENNWMALGQFDYNYRKYQPNSLSIGAGIRYYVEANGLYIGAGANYMHSGVDDCTVDDFVPNIHVGYAYFLSRTVTIEPEFYYNQSLKDHSNYSGPGVRIGLGIYLDDILK